MNLKEIEEMIKLMNENKLTEIELERNGLKIRLKKEDETVKKYIEKDPGPIKQNLTEAEVGKPQETSIPKGGIEIKAPMVGTFYRAPSPESPPYAEVGQIINPGDVICIIEAMKLMNEIKSEVKGKVIEILCENGTSVEFGQTLFLIEPEI